MGALFQHIERAKAGSDEFSLVDVLETVQSEFTRLDGNAGGKPVDLAPLESRLKAIEDKLKAVDAAISK